MEIILKRIALQFAIGFIRYLLFAGVLYLIFYVWKPQRYIIKKIQQKFPDSKNIQHEIIYSILSMGIFSLLGGFIFWLSKNGYTQIYLDFKAHSVGYFIFSVVALIVAHDTYFYWTHRFMHWKKIYRYVHKIHHISVNPTPWAAFSFHPFEAIIEIGVLLIMVFVMPLHPVAIIIWILFMTLQNVFGHLGFELFPSGFTTNPILGLQNTSTHHNMHHKYVECNYGLYFNIWDKIMKTNHEKYHEEFEKVARIK